jgi:hypothetical protein
MTVEELLALERNAEGASDERHSESSAEEDALAWRRAAAEAGVPPD